MPMNPRLLRPMASGFNPRSISGLSLWLDASDSSTITLNGSNVSEWRDKSGAGSPAAAQGFAANQPAYNASGLNGRGTIDFATTRSLVFGSSTASFNYLHNSTGGTVFIVIRPGDSSDPNAYAPFLINNNDTSANTGISLAFDDRVSVSRNNALVAVVNRGVSGFQTAAIIPNNFFATANAYCVLSVAYDCGNATASSRMRAYLNGTVNATTNTVANAAATGNASANMTIGSAGGGTRAAVAEMLFYQGVLSTSRRQTVERYLGKKYGITVA
jgi:hypothetical protein